MIVLPSAQRCAAAMAFGVLVAVLPGAAAAQSCSFTVSDVNFGTVDLTANTPYDTTANYTASCSGGTPGQTLHLCPNLGTGSGGANGANAPRYLLSSGNQLSYNLYTDSGRSSVWGSYQGGGSPPELSITLNGSGAGSVNGTMYARVFAGQQSRPIGTYVSNFSGSPDASLSWAVESGADCTAIGSSNATAFSFTASASYPATCTVTGAVMDFGTLATLSAPVDASATLTTTCSAASPYTVGLNDGLSPTGAMQRRMRFGTNYIAYSLFKEAARVSHWGNSGGDLSSAVGTGSVQSHIVYGRIPSQLTPVSGTYNDTVVVTVTY